MGWLCICVCFFFKQKTAYEMRISDWSSDVCSSDLVVATIVAPAQHDVTVRMAGVEMVDRHPVELRSQILFHLRHQPAHERLEVGILIAVLGRDDEAELMTIVATTFEKRLVVGGRSEEHTSELQSLMRTSYAVFCLK